MKFKVQTFIAAILVTNGLQILPAAARDAEILLRNEVGDALAMVLEPLARRELTPAEKRAVTAEFIPLLGDSECTARCAQMVRYNLERIAPVREIPGSPLDLRTRHDYISQLYFSQTQSGGLIQRLSAEADPVFVVETAPQRLMTRLDVIASMNIYHFSQGSGPPEARRFSESDVEAAAATLSRIYGPSEYVMPRHLALAATYWRGLELHWASFNEAQRERVRAYFSAKRIRRPLPAHVYSTLLGLTANEASSFYMDEANQALAGIVGAQFDVVVERYKNEGYSWLWAPH